MRMKTWAWMLWYTEDPQKEVPRDTALTDVEGHLHDLMSTVLREAAGGKFFEFMLGELLSGNGSMFPGVQQKWGLAPDQWSYAPDEEYGAHPTLDKFLKVIG
jgi:hypothetical protein